MTTIAKHHMPRVDLSPFSPSSCPSPIPHLSLCLSHALAGSCLSTQPSALRLLCACVWKVMREGQTESSHNVEFKAKHGASPDLFLYNIKDEVVKTYDLTTLDQKECNELLINLGFYKRPNSAADVPPQYMEGPYVPLNEEGAQDDVITSRKSDL
ncbi:selenoprotein M-like [Elysia marginata]|uniref:Selenoprotein M-like n=1 Tax=Elysia marginata TaxID=1093978 RepID=A0AAV4IKC7_9GAST|nr:selenoprotein M-like [Elysia marginata]